MNYTLGYKVLECNNEKDYLTIQLCSPEFKNDSSTYPIINIAISNLDHTTDISKQIGQIIAPLTKSIIKQESTDREPFISRLNELVGQTQLISSAEAALPSQPPSSLESAGVNFIA